MHRAAGARALRDSSPPPAGCGRSAGRADREAPPVDRANTTAGAIWHSRRPPPRPALRAATAYSRHIAPAAPAALAPRPAAWPRSSARDRAPTAPATSRPRQCGAAAATARARSRPAQTAAPAAVSRARDRSRVARLPSASRQARPHSPSSRSAAPAPHPLPGLPAAEHRASPGRSCAGSRGGPPHPPVRFPVPSHQALRSAARPAGSRRSRSPPPADPGTTVAAAQTTAGSPLDAQRHARGAAPADPRRDADSTPPPWAPRTGCGSTARHRGSRGCG